MQISKNLERLAQSHGCVRKHADHRSTDLEAQLDDPNPDKYIAKIIQCDGGCRKTEWTDCGGDRDSSLPKVWTKENPTFLWDYCACQGIHMRFIVQTTRVGCSAEVDTNGETCIFCYLNKKKPPPYLPWAGCTKTSIGPRGGK